MKKLIIVLCLFFVLNCDNTSSQGVSYTGSQQLNRVDKLRSNYSDLSGSIVIAEELAKVTEELKKILEVLESKKEKSE